MHYFFIFHLDIFSEYKLELTIVVLDHEEKLMRKYNSLFFFFEICILQSMPNFFFHTVCYVRYFFFGYYGRTDELCEHQMKLNCPLQLRNHFLALSMQLVSKVSLQYIMSTVVKRLIIYITPHILLYTQLLSNLFIGLTIQLIPFCLDFLQFSLQREPILFIYNFSYNSL